MGKPNCSKKEAATEASGALESWERHGGDGGRKIEGSEVKSR
jgi:hypothetical protein